MANKYLEKIAETLSEQEVQHEAGKNVSRKYLGRILGSPIPGGNVLGAHLLGKGQINALEGSLNRPKSNHKTVAHNQVRATLRGAEYAGTKNWMRRMYGEGSDTSSK